MGFYEAALARDQEKKELEALAAIKAAQNEISKRDDARKFFDTAAQLDFSQMKTTPPPQAIPEDYGYAAAPTSSPVPEYEPQWQGLADEGLKSIARRHGLTGEFSTDERVQNFMKDIESKKASELEQSADRVIADSSSEFTKEKPNAGKVMTDLAPFAELPNVKEYMQRITPLYDTGRASVFSLQQDTPETKAAALKRLEQLKGDPNYESIDWDLWQTAITNIPNGAYKFFDKFSTGQQATGEKLRGEELGRPGKVNTAAQTASATTTAKSTAEVAAPKPIDDKESNTLQSVQSTFANLGDAAKAFKKGFASPYIGRKLKSGLFRPNDPEFASFVTPLALAMNSYRKENFGTAQSAQEIQNFLDVINTDLAISPNAFMAQLDRVMASMQRDYKTRVTTLDGRNVVVPQNLRQLPVSSSTDVSTTTSLLTPEKAKRLAELRAKQAAGTLGR